MGQALRKDERIAQTFAFKRRAIVDAARDVVAEKGAEALTIRAVAARAGYTPGAVYSYFSNRDELALELLAQDLSRLSRELKTGPDLTAMLLKLVEALQDKDSFAPYASAMMDTNANPPDNEAGRAVTGRLIQCLAHIAEAVRNDSPTSADADRNTVALSALALGLAMLQKSGRLDLLGFEAGDLIRHVSDRILR